MTARLGPMLVATVLALAGQALAFAGQAAAEGPFVEIRLLEGFRTDGGQSIDARLTDLPQLTQDQPFVRYNVFRLLDRKELPLGLGQTVRYELVNGRTLQLTLASVAQGNGQKRYRMEAQIVEPGKRAFLRSLHVTAGQNQPFFVGGQHYRGGPLFVEVVVRP